jgi:hypothetical protein
MTASYAQDTPLDALRASDVNADGVINILDLTLVASFFGKIPTVDQTSNPDVNGDGAVNILDLTLVAGHLGKTVTIRPPVVFVSADPVIDSQLDVNGTITLTFDNTPEDVTVNTGVATTTDETVTITGPFDPGAIALTITWKDGTQTLTYTVRQPAAFVSAKPAIDSQIEVDDTITLTFDIRPRDVTVSTGTARTLAKTVRITGPFDPGPLALTITWSDGSLTLTYSVTEPDSEAPEITDGTVSDGDKGVNPETINSDARIEVTFSEAVSGNIVLRTAAGVDAGWLGKVDGNKGTLELVKDKELGNEITYVIAGTVRDAAGNETNLNITFTTASKTSGIPFEVSDATFNALVVESTIPIVVEFYTDW